MTVLPGQSTGPDDARSSSSTVAGAPVRADGVELIGEMVGSGYREPPALARRGDGQTFQLTPHPGRAVDPAARSGPPGSGRLVEGQRGSLVTGWADGDARPTHEKPQLALVLVPRGTDASTDSSTGDEPVTAAPAPATTDTGTVDVAQPWVFPFNKPLAPQAGDNQAVAVNTTDNTVQYDVAFVLVTGDNHVAVKQNNSAAVNYDCVNCLSYAFATQLFVTLDGPLSDAGTQQIAALWQQITDFGTHITEVPLSEIRDRLTAYEQQILQVIEKEQGPLTPDAPAAVPSRAVRS